MSAKPYADTSMTQCISLTRQCEVTCVCGFFFLHKTHGLLKRKKQQKMPFWLMKGTALKKHPQCQYLAVEEVT